MWLNVLALIEMWIYSIANISEQPPAMFRIFQSSLHYESTPKKFWERAFEYSNFYGKVMEPYTVHNCIIAGVQDQDQPRSNRATVPTRIQGMEMWKWRSDREAEKKSDQGKGRGRGIGRSETSPGREMETKSGVTVRPNLILLIYYEHPPPPPVQTHCLFIARKRSL